MNDARTRVPARLRSPSLHPGMCNRAASATIRSALGRDADAEEVDVTIAGDWRLQWFSVLLISSVHQRRWNGMRRKRTNRFMRAVRRGNAITRVLIE